MFDWLRKTLKATEVPQPAQPNEWKSAATTPFIIDSCNGKSNLTEKEAKILRTHVCPDCGGDLYSGPCGGMMMNVSCKNGHRFNITNPEIRDCAPFFCERI